MDQINNSTTNVNPLSGSAFGANKTEGIGDAQASSVVPTNSALGVSNGRSSVSMQPVAGVAAAPFAASSSQPAPVLAKPLTPRPPVPPLVSGVRPTNTTMRPTNIDGINNMVSSSSMPSGLTDDIMNSPVKESETLPNGESTAMVLEGKVEINSNAPAVNPLMVTGSRPTPSVSFADSTTQPEGIGVQEASVSKKKSGRTVLMVLSVIAFVVAIVLTAVLIMIVMGVGPFA